MEKALERRMNDFGIFEKFGLELKVHEGAGLLVSLIHEVGDLLFHQVEVFTGKFQLFGLLRDDRN